MSSAMKVFCATFARNVASDVRALFGTGEGEPVEPQFISVTVDGDRALAGQAIRWDREKVTIEITNPEVLEQWMQLDRPVLTISARHLPRYHAGERIRGED